MIPHYKGLICVKEAALICNYSTQAIRKAIVEKRLKAWRIGHQYVLDPNDVADYCYDHSKAICVLGRKKKNVYDDGSI